MKAAPVISALAIPREALVEQRVQKAAGRAGRADGRRQRRIQTALRNCHGGGTQADEYRRARLKDDVREYLEIAVLTVVLRPAAKPPRLIELIHRAIPYPLVLIAEHGGAASFSLAHKRWSQGEAEKIVIEDVRHVPLNPDSPSDVEASFWPASPFRAFPHATCLHCMRVSGSRGRMEAARITGTFTPPESAERASIRREGLEVHAVLQHDLAILRQEPIKKTSSTPRGAEPRNQAPGTGTGRGRKDTIRGQSRDEALTLKIPKPDPRTSSRRT